MNEKKNKLNVLLGVTDHLASVFKKSVEDFLKFFKNSQGAFRGERKTYEAKAGTMDDPAERKNHLVVTTVDEKFRWLEDNSAPYINALFDQERTNASGTAKAQLVVDGQNFGEFTSLELLRLKTLLEHGVLKEMYENIPVRNDDEEWKKTTAEMYTNRKEVFESALREGVKKTTMKESYILHDPNIGKTEKPLNYTPQVANKDTIIELGNYTHQKFSGEWSHRQRAELLARRTKLLTAVIEALKMANEAEIVQSEMTAEKIFGYLHTGAIKKPE